MGELQDYALALDLIEDYLNDYGGDYSCFVAYITARQRLGQAFFNALSQHDQVILCGSLYDPFYKGSHEHLTKTIEWLLFRGK